MKTRHAVTCTTPPFRLSVYTLSAMDVNDKTLGLFTDRYRETPQEERLLGHAHGRVAPDALEAQRGDAVEV